MDKDNFFADLAKFRDHLHRDSGVGSGGGGGGGGEEGWAGRPMAPPIILKGGPGPPNISSCLYYIRCCRAVILDLLVG